MPDRYLIAEHGRMRPARYVNDAVVLDVRAFADAYVVHVAANDGAEPDARLLTDLDVSDHGRIFSDKGCRVNDGEFIFEF